MKPQFNSIKTTIKTNTLSMDTSLQVESVNKQMRYRKSMVSQELKKGMTKSGGFKRPASSCFY